MCFEVVGFDACDVFFVGFFRSGIVSRDFLRGNVFLSGFGTKLVNFLKCFYNFCNDDKAGSGICQDQKFSKLTSQSFKSKMSKNFQVKKVKFSNVLKFKKYKNLSLSFWTSKSSEIFNI